MQKNYSSITNGCYFTIWGMVLNNCAFYVMCAWGSAWNFFFIIQYDFTSVDTLAYIFNAYIRAWYINHISERRVNSQFKFQLLIIINNSRPCQDLNPRPATDLSTKQTTYHCATVLWLFMSVIDHLFFKGWSFLETSFQPSSMVYI